MKNKIKVEMGGELKKMTLKKAVKSNVIPIIRDV